MVILFDTAGIDVFMSLLLLAVVTASIPLFVFIFFFGVSAAAL